MYCKQFAVCDQWEEKDLNPQSPKTPDLQSGPLPITVYLPKWYLLQCGNIIFEYEGSPNGILM